MRKKPNSSPPPDDGLTTKQRAKRQRDAEARAAGNNLAVVYPQIAKLWLPEHNDGVQAQGVSPNTPRVHGWWRCQYCGGIHASSVSNRTKSAARGCHACGNVRRRRSNAQRRKEMHEAGDNLAACFPEIAAELIGADPSDLSRYSHAELLWRCSTCGFEYPAAVRDRTAGGNGCPECWRLRRIELANQRALQAARSGNNVAALHPKLVPEWHPNNDMGPEAVTPRSHKVILWLGPCGHEWPARVAGRTDPDQPRGCAVCAGRRVSPDRNFAARSPRLALEWGERNEQGPETYTPASDQLVWWTCNNAACRNEYEMTITHRLAGSSCPLCTMAKRSKVEIWIAFELAHFLPGMNPRKNPRVTADGHTYELDAVLSETKKIAFEYDGCRFHSDKGGKDRRRSAALAAAGWKVIHAREDPLEPFNAWSFTVNGGRAWRKPHRVAQQVLALARDPCGLILSPQADAYLEADSPVASDQADAFIATKRVRAWTKRRSGTVDPDVADRSRSERPEAAFQVGSAVERPTKP